MYMLIDKERMAVVYRHPSRDVVLCIERIECAHSETLLFDDAYPAGLISLEAVELLRLYTSLTGKVFPGLDHGKLVAVIYQIVIRIPPIEIEVLKVIAQAYSIRDTDKGFYKFNPASVTPIALEEQYVPPSLLPGDVPITAAPVPAKTFAPVVPLQQIKGETKYLPPWS